MGHFQIIDGFHVWVKWSEFFIPSSDSASFVFPTSRYDNFLIQTSEPVRRANYLQGK